MTATWRSCGGVRPTIGALLADAGGFAADVHVAAAVNVSDVVPVLVDGAFRAQHGTSCVPAPG